MQGNRASKLELVAPGANSLREQKVRKNQPEMLVGRPGSPVVGGSVERGEQSIEDGKLEAELGGELGWRHEAGSASFVRGKGARPARRRLKRPTCGRGAGKQTGEDEPGCRADGTRKRWRRRTGAARRKQRA